MFYNYSMEKIRKTNTDDTFKHALFALLDNNDYSDIGVNDICAKAGFSKQTFYRLYGNKDEFVQHIIQDEIDKYQACVDKLSKETSGINKPEDIDKLRLSVFKHIYNRRKYYHYLFKYSCFFGFRIKLVELLKVSEKLPIFLFSNADAEDYNLEYLNIISTYFSYASIEFYINSNFSYTPEEMASFYYKTLKYTSFVTLNDLGLTYNNIKNK